MNIFKTKSIVVDAFTINEVICDHFPIESASKFYPSWWKEMPKSFLSSDQQGMQIDASTIKRCRGFIDLYSTGFIIPLWADMHIETRDVDEECVWKYSTNGMPSMVSHPKSQYGNTFDNFKHLKIITPWLMREKTGVQFHFTSPTWSNVSYLDGMNILPGIIDYKYQVATNVNLFMPHNRIYHIEHGTPLVHIIPITDKEIKIKCHTISAEEYYRIENSRTYHMSFLNNYGSMKKAIDKKEAKCPFGFGKG